jgi:hypothetical protein
VSTRRKSIGRMYQRSMDLRDSTPVRNFGAAQFDAIEEEYSSAYRSAFRTGNLAAFVRATHKYRKLLRSVMA